MKVPNNKLSSVKKYFLAELEPIVGKEAKSFFSFLCEAWLGLTRSDLILNPDKEISESEILKFLYGIKDLKKNRPVQYVAGKTWFYGLEIRVEEGVLIPRPETEELVDWIVTSNSNKNAKNIVDIGTGSGCIGLAIKSKLIDANVTGLDFSDEALKIAKCNAENLSLDVRFQQFDALNWQEFKFENKFDLIVSNPPYIPEEDKASMHPNVLDYEPDMALFVPNESPLIFYEAIADFAKENLKKGGAVYFEIHEDFGLEVGRMLNRKGFDPLVLCDLQAKERMVRATLK
jgi:release factor glutamine methyltransferase